MVKLLFFAALVDRLGAASEDIELPATVTTVGQLLAALRERGGVWADTFSTGAVRVTVNKQFADLDAPIKNGDEVALISTWM
jgi:molybdopterin synthase sulfur carrier subunit